jgi:hypothetical protein
MLPPYDPPTKAGRLRKTAPPEAVPFKFYPLSGRDNMMKNLLKIKMPRNAISPFVA